ncbi:ROK family transcriptional regulator [Sphingomonas sp. PP-CC-3G-468]|uniref:ROK family protein n=1 Tax=Sphingomonas sp. PP-CC-3G-468 TaxID=2135656 RepID=UPI00104991AF|nr:ROK family transcriptional regulator [Sphingomonas sp. PP-CC-3G-468]TCM07431.1 putative NBD/HSP70 family sugar kinase [Sphingomonas sp. PP-CC-3G-468]
MLLPHRPEILLTEQQKRILWQLRIGGPSPRIQLAETLGMNGASMTRVTQQMMALGIVEEREAEGASTRGRPTVPLAVSGHGGWAVGATVHPGWLELVLVDFSGRPLIHDSLRFDSPDPLVFARTLDARLRALAADHGFMRGRFLGLGVAVPGYAIRDTRDHRQVVDRLAGWSDVPLADMLGDVLGMSVWIENDATAAALAEFYQKDIIGRYRSVLVLFLGHGIGAGLIADRDLFAGEYGNAGEVGRLFPSDQPRPSGIDLLRMLQNAGEAVESLSDIAALQQSQASLIADWSERVAHQLDFAVAMGTVWLDPGSVIISGALPLPMLERLAERIDQLGSARDTGYRGGIPRVHASSIGSSAVVIGAALAPIHAVTAPGTDGEPVPRMGKRARPF